MIGLDTNVLVRYIVQDDLGQANAAARLIEGRCTSRSPGYVSVPVLVELVWVLAGAYRYERAVVAAVIRQLLRTIELRVEDRDAAWSALREFEAGSADFADSLIAHRSPIETAPEAVRRPSRSTAPPPAVTTLRRCLNPTSHDIVKDPASLVQSE